MPVNNERIEHAARQIHHASLYGGLSAEVTRAKAAPSIADPHAMRRNLSAIGVEKRLIFKMATGSRGWAVRMGQRIDDGRSDSRPKNAGRDSGARAAKTWWRQAIGGGAVNGACRAFGGMMQIRPALGGVMEVRLVSEGPRNKGGKNTARDCNADQDC